MIPTDPASPSSTDEILPLSLFGIGPIWWAAGVIGLLVLLLVARSVHRRVTESSGAHVAGEVVGVVGRPGSGKTLFAVRFAAQQLKAGGTVCTNFTMSIPSSWPGTWVRYQGWSQLVTLQDCVVVLDEAHLEAPSTVGAGSSGIPSEARWYLSQVRRMGVSLVWVSQHEMRVNKTLRDLTNYIWVCNSFRRGKGFKATQYEPERLRRPEQHLEIRRWRADPELWGLFDTWEILMPGDGEGSAVERRIHELAADRNRRRGIERVGQEAEDGRECRYCGMAALECLAPVLACCDECFDRTHPAVARPIALVPEGGPRRPDPGGAAALLDDSEVS